MSEIFVLTEFEMIALALSLKVALWAMAVSLPLGVACAYLLARADFPGKTLVDGLIHMPLVLPPVVVGYALLVSFGRQGVLGSWLHDAFGLQFIFDWKGAALASGVIAFPLLVRAARLSIEAVDRKLEAAARTLGASPLRVFFTITLPLALPGLLTGGILCFARSLSEFGATITFVSNIPGETQTLPLALYTLTQTPGGDAGALRLCLISAAAALAALVASESLARRARKRIGQ